MNIVLRSLCPTFLRKNDSQVWHQPLELSPETYINIAAPSGRGKTSFLAILYGLLKDYAGSLQFDGREVASFSRSQWCRLRQRQLSLVFQDLRLFPHLTGLQNCLLNAEQTGVADRDQISAAFRRLGVEGLLDVPSETCSQGEKQRIAFIRAISQPFAWILLDEPFSHLDASRVQAMCELLEDACRRNRAGLIMTSLQASSLLPFHRTYLL